MLAVVTTAVANRFFVGCVLRTHDTLTKCRTFSQTGNIQNLYVHEFVGHFVKGFGDATKTHYKVYELEISHPTFNQCTTKYKENAIDFYNTYKNQETR